MSSGEGKPELESGEPDFSQLTIVLDESGASGANFLDTDQPYFIQGGIVTQSQNIIVLREKFLAWERKHLQPNQKEIKSKIFKSADGFEKFHELFHELKSFIIAPTYSVLEKRYAACFVLVEAFLDPFYNSALTNNQFFWDNDRKDWALLLREKLTLDTLSKFNDVLRNHSFSSFVDTHDAIVADLRASTHIDLARKFDACPREDAFRFVASPDYKNMAINAIGFRSHMFAIKNELIRHSPKRIKIIHDEQLHYQAVFEEFLKITNRGVPQVAPISREHSVILGGIGDWTLEFSPSDGEPLVRFSDLLCGFLQKSLAIIHEGRSLPRFADELFTLFWTPILRHVFPDRFNDIPKWNYEGIPTETQHAILKAMRVVREGLD